MTIAITDTDRLLLVARVYFYLKGGFTSQELYDFIFDNNCGFRRTPSVRGIAATLTRSPKFTAKEGKNRKKIFEVC